MKIKYNLFYYFIILFYLTNTSFSTELKYTLRRYEDDFSKKKYTGTVEYKSKKRDKIENETKIVQNKLPTKNNKYEGYYKVGTPYTVSEITYYPKEQPDYKETGMASWYGKDFHNKKTSNGETYNMNDYTAAHRTLPMPSIVKVTNLENGKSMQVRINDRGPFVKGRIIDVSKKVAKSLDFHEQGTTKVKVEFLKNETEDILKKYGLK